MVPVGYTHTLPLHRCRLVGTRCAHIYAYVRLVRYRTVHYLRFPTPTPAMVWFTFCLPACRRFTFVTHAHTVPFLYRCRLRFWLHAVTRYRCIRTAFATWLLRSLHSHALRLPTVLVPISLYCVYFTGLVYGYTRVFAVLRIIRLPSIPAWLLHRLVTRALLLPPLYAHRSVPVLRFTTAQLPAFPPATPPLRVRHFTVARGLPHTRTTRLHLPAFSCLRLRSTGLPYVHGWLFYAYYVLTHCSSVIPSSAGFIYLVCVHGLHVHRSFCSLRSRLPVAVVRSAGCVYTTGCVWLLLVTCGYVTGSLHTLLDCGCRLLHTWLPHYTVTHICYVRLPFAVTVVPHCRSYVGCRYLYPLRLPLILVPDYPSGCYTPSTFIDFGLRSLHYHTGCTVTLRTYYTTQFWLLRFTRLVTHAGSRSPVWLQLRCRYVAVTHGWLRSSVHVYYTRYRHHRSVTGWLPRTHTCGLRTPFLRLRLFYRISRRLFSGLRVCVYVLTTTFCAHLFTCGCTTAHLYTLPLVGCTRSALVCAAFGSICLVYYVYGSADTARILHIALRLRGSRGLHRGYAACLAVAGSFCILPLPGPVPCRIRLCRSYGYYLPRTCRLDYRAAVPRFYRLVTTACHARRTFTLLHYVVTVYATRCWLRFHTMRFSSRLHCLLVGYTAFCTRLLRFARLRLYVAHAFTFGLLRFGYRCVWFTFTRTHARGCGFVVTTHRFYLPAAHTRTFTCRLLRFAFVRGSAGSHCVAFGSVRLRYRYARTHARCWFVRSLLIDSGFGI